MNPRVRPRPIAAAAAILTAWSALQLWLVRRSELHRYDEFVTAQRLMLAKLRRIDADPAALRLPPTPPSPTFNDWGHVALVGIAGAGILVLLAAAIVIGGRRWWALVVVAYPLANVWGWFMDGRPLGLGWFPFDAYAHAQAWLAVARRWTRSCSPRSRCC